MSKKNQGGYVYSTNPDFIPEHESSVNESRSPKEQTLGLHRETKGRGGKAVVIVRGFISSDDELSDLGKQLKAHCGTGGSSKNGEIIIQGDQRDKVKAFLEKLGFKTKNIGG